jgi:ABC-2 type transport system ATP-binding protein
VVAQDSPTALTARLADRTITARTRLDVDELRALPGVLTVDRDGDRVRVTSSEPEEVLRVWLPLDRGLTDLRVEGAGLEQALLALTDDTAGSAGDEAKVEVPA